MISVAIATCSSVPMIAWYAPPLLSCGPMLRIEWPKNSASSRAVPLLTRVNTTDTSGSRASVNAE